MAEIPALKSGNRVITSFRLMWPRLPNKVPSQKHNSKVLAGKRNTASWTHLWASPVTLDSAFVHTRTHTNLSGITQHAFKSKARPSQPFVGLLRKRTESYKMGLSEDSFIEKAFTVSLKPWNSWTFSGVSHFWRDQKIGKLPLGQHCSMHVGGRDQISWAILD